MKWGHDEVALRTAGRDQELHDFGPGSCKNSICFRVRGEQAGTGMGKRDSGNVITCSVEMMSCWGCKHASALQQKKLSELVFTTVH